MALTSGLTEINGLFASQARMVASKLRAGATVAVQTGSTIQWYDIDAADAGSGVQLTNLLYANPVESPQTDTNTSAISTNTSNIATNVTNIATNTAAIAVLKKRTTATGTATFLIGVEYFLTANSTITMPDVTGFTGGERFKVVASIAAVSSTLTVDGTQSELIKTSTGGSHTVFNLTNTGVNFEFIFNAVTGHWEV
jgi:hypothetical protein